LVATARIDADSAISRHPGAFRKADHLEHNDDRATGWIWRHDLLAVVGAVENIGGAGPVALLGSWALGLPSLVKPDE